VIVCIVLVNLLRGSSENKEENKEEKKDLKNEVIDG